MSSNPVLVEVTRGRRVESVHRGAIAIVEDTGSLLFQAGAIDEPIYPRSAVKPIQALVMVESGAADAFGYGNRELALAQASHSGQPEHVDVVMRMLAGAGVSESDLKCGAHSPTHRPSSIALRAAGRVPTTLHNNCSGKHAGMLSAARQLGFPTREYETPGHPIQRLVCDALEDLTGFPLSSEVCGVDGCSIPTYPIPLRALTFGMARFATGSGLSAKRAGAARRLLEAAIAEPFYIAGSGRFCTELMRLAAPELLTKTGAEGVFCACLPKRGVGVALKSDDGATRASEVMMAAVLARLFPEHAGAMAQYLHVPVRSIAKAIVGEVRPVGAEFAEIR